MAPSEKSTYGRWRVSFGGVQPAASGLPDPVGYHPSAGREQEDANAKQRRSVDASLKQKKAWEIATGQSKNIGMMCFMMYMSGSGIQIFSILVTFNGIITPVRSIMSSAKPFEGLIDDKVDTTGPRLLFVAINLAGLAFAVYRLNIMGLLPTTVSDWVSSLPAPLVLEYSAS